MTPSWPVTYPCLSFRGPWPHAAQQWACPKGKGYLGNVHCPGPLPWAEEPGSSEKATAPPKVTEPRGTYQARDGCPFSSPALLTSRRLRSAGCSRRERLSRYCHRGLSSGGSRLRCRRNRHGGHRLPARKRVDQGLGLWGTSGQPELRPSARNRGLCSSPSLRVRPFARPPAEALQGLQQPIDPAYPGRGQWQRRRPARPSPGQAWRAKRAGVQAGSWRGWETAADHVRWSHQGQTRTRGQTGRHLVPAVPCPCGTWPRAPSGGHIAVLQAPLKRGRPHLVAAWGTARGPGAGLASRVRCASFGGPDAFASGAQI